ncbi:MAG: SH3 domain-containing protein [Clostridiaceae bacterium]
MLKRKLWLSLVSTLTSSMLLFACNATPPNTPSGDTPINEETPIVEPSQTPVETPVETGVETEVESPSESYSLAPMEKPEAMTYDRTDLNLNAMSINLLLITKNFDLNSDGQADEIVMIARDFTSPDALADTYEEYELLVNQMNFRGYSSDFEPRFNIVDLDARDRYREIAVSEYGESEDPATTFFKYDGISLDVIGTIPGFYGKRYENERPTEGLGSVIIDGTGVIKTNKTSTFLMTWNYDAEYQFENGTTLSEIEKDLYPLNHEVTMLTDLTLKKSRTDTNDGITLKKGELVTLKECDNKEWVAVTNSAGEIGWFAVDENNIVIGTGKPATEIFEGLFSAG